jgi:hypothetical protein
LEALLASDYRDGWAAKTFHSNCDYKNRTVTLVKVGQYIFGGYATASWEGKISELHIYTWSKNLSSKSESKMAEIEELLDVSSSPFLLFLYLRVAL